MYFLVIGHGNPNLNFDDERTADAAVQSHMYREKLVQEGVIVVHGHIVGHKGHVWVYNVNGVDELDQVMTKDPMYPWLQHDPLIYPFVSESRARELEQQMFADRRKKFEG